MKHIDKYTIISILSSFLLFSCSEGLEIKSGSMILSVDKDMHMTVELTGNDAPLTEKSQTEYIELEEGTVSDFKLKSRDTRVVGDTTVYTLIGEASMLSVVLSKKYKRLVWIVVSPVWPLPK